MNAALPNPTGLEKRILTAWAAAVLAAVAAIALGLDTGLLTRLSLASTAALEERLMDAFASAFKRAQGVTPDQIKPKFGIRRKGASA